MKRWAAFSPPALGLVLCAFEALAESSPPEVLDAYVQLNTLTEIRVVFSEPMSDYALDVYNYFIHETENAFNDVTLLGARFEDPPRNTTVILTPMSPLSATAAYTFNIAAGSIADATGEYVGDVTRSLQRERLVLAADRDQDWKYHAEGIDLGSSWKEPAYDDHAWSNGIALFYSTAYGPYLGVPIQPGTGLPSVDSFNRPIKTFYFRSKIFSPYTNATNVRLRSTLGDGGVVYIDGVEVWRFSMPAPPTPIIYDTPATSRATNYNWFPRTNLPAAAISVPLPPGEHVIAVEVHSYSAPQRPVAMALMLTAFAEAVCACPLQFAENLDPKWTIYGPVMPLRVRVNGTFPQYQWFKDGSPIPNATNHTYTVPTDFCSGTGRYWVRVTNEVNAIESPRYWIQWGDLEPPNLLSATAEADRTTIRVEFNDYLTLSWATNTDNYRIEGLRILNITPVSNSFNQKFRLHTEPRQRGRFYELTVLNTARSTCLTNIEWPTIHTMIDLEEALVWYDSVWAYHDLGIDLGTTWPAPEYDDSAWPRGPALLGVENTVETIANLQARGFAVHTPLLLPNDKPTYYFRTQFENPFSSLTNFHLTHVVDDGAVFYLDGVELARFNMPQGPVDYSTLAPAEEGRYVTNGVYTIIPGLHTLAAEVHQASTASSDVLFGAAFEMVVRAPPRVRLTRNADGNLEVQAVSGVIESAPSLDGPWSFGIWGGPYEVLPTDSARFYRARRD